MYGTVPLPASTDSPSSSTGSGLPACLLVALFPQWLHAWGPGGGLVVAGGWRPHPRHCFQIQHICPRPLLYMCFTIKSRGKWMKMKWPDVYRHLELIRRKEKERNNKNKRHNWLVSCDFVKRSRMLFRSRCEKAGGPSGWWCAAA